jgi:hypothetical protein
LAVDFAAKSSGLTVIANALNRGDVALARIVAVQLQLPDLPRIEKRIGPEDRTAKLAFLLRRGGLLKEDWDPEKHPRWPAGSPDGQGGEFAPAGEETSGGSSLVQLDSPECAEEWNYAETRCDELRNSPSFGTTGRLGFGRTFEQCVRGMVSERCGRNPIR